MLLCARLAPTNDYQLTKDELKEEDFEAYLASDDEHGGDSDGGGDGDAPGADGDADKLRERYRALLLSGGSGAEDKRRGGK
eukprot:359806-Chlamydomonas_euryale.AAC.2